MCEYRPLGAGGKEPGHCGSCNPPKEACTLPTLPLMCVRCVCAFVCLCCVLCVVPDPLGRLIRRRLVHASNVIFAFLCLFVHNSVFDVCGSRSGSNAVNSLKFKTESQQSLAKEEQLVTAGKGFPACTRPSLHQSVCPQCWCWWSCWWWASGKPALALVKASR